jgi:hypothetical protein
MVARSATSKQGRVLTSIDHLIETKRWAMRPRDVQDIQYLEELLAAKAKP